MIQSRKPVLDLILKALYAGKWHGLCNFDLHGQFEVFMNVLLYAEWLYMERFSLWYILYKLIELYLRVTVPPKQFGTGQRWCSTSQLLQGHIINFK